MTSADPFADLSVGILSESCQDNVASFGYDDLICVHDAFTISLELVV